MAKQLTEVGSALPDEAQAASAPRTLRKRSRLEVWLFLIPAILFNLAWGWFPLVSGIAISFTDGNAVQPSQFVGFDNYRHVLTDPLVLQAFEITFIYAILSIVLTFVLPIIVAVFLMEMPRKVVYWMMFLWFMPLSSIATLILMRYFYDPDYGLFQFLFVNILHLPHQNFLQDPHLVLFWLVFPGILFFGPGLLYIAGLQGVPSSYYEAAEVEGAGFWRKIWTISLPRIRPIIALVLLLTLVTSLQIYDQPQILTQGGPFGMSRTIMIYVYDQIGALNYGSASAIAVLIFLVTLAVVIIQRVLFKEDLDA